CLVFFFFSSRRRHTRCYRDWSSDVCSSDLSLVTVLTATVPLVVRAQTGAPVPPPTAPARQHRQRRERHPELMRALRTLQRAKTEIGRASCRARGTNAERAGVGEKKGETRDS